MAHKTLIGGTAYEIVGGKALAGGTGYSIEKGKALVGGTAYEIKFENGAVVTVSWPDTRVEHEEEGYLYYKYLDESPGYLLHLGVKTYDASGNLLENAYFSIWGPYGHSTIDSLVEAGFHSWIGEYDRLIEAPCTTEFVVPDGGTVKVEAGFWGGFGSKSSGTVYLNGSSYYTTPMEGEPSTEEPLPFTVTGNISIVANDPYDGLNITTE